MTPGEQFAVKVVGLSFVPGYPGNVYQLRLWVDHARQTGQVVPVELVRNPANPHDANAVEVRVSGVPVGHLPRTLAAELAPLLDAGHRWRVWVDDVLVMPGREQNPGLSVRGVPA